MAKRVLDLRFTDDERLHMMDQVGLVFSGGGTFSGSKMSDDGLRETQQQQQQKIIRVFTDGSCIGNGKQNAVAGIGVYFPNQEMPNVGLPYWGQRLRVCPDTGTCTPIDESSKAALVVTNQRAELEAIYVAIELASQAPGYVPKRVHIHLYTDSEYAINSLTKWVYDWERNNWQTAARKQVKNRDLIEPLFAMLGRHRVVFFHSPAHTNGQDERSKGNAMADALAQRGSAAAGPPPPNNGGSGRLVKRRRRK